MSRLWGWAPLRVGVPLVVVAALLFGGVVAAAAALNGSSSKPPVAVLRWSNEGVSDLFTLDPARGPDFNARQAGQMIFGGLVRFGPGLTILPDVARTWDLSRDGRTYTFHLRPNVRFGDGSVLHARDVAYSLQRVLSRQFADHSGATLLQGIDGAPESMSGASNHVRGISVPDDRTVRIHLHAPSGSFLSKLANPAGWVVSPARVRADPFHWDEHALGTGPFMVSRWVHQNELLLKPNPYYYGGPLQIGGVEMPFIPESLAAYKRYRAGAVDLMGTIHFPVDMLYDVQTRRDFSRSARLEVVYLPLNTRSWPFTDVRVRLAFARALDKSVIVRDVYQGFAHPTNGMMPPGLPGYDPAFRGPAFSPPAARRLLASAGFGGSHPFPSVTFPVDQGADSIVLAAALAAQWQHNLGVNVRLKQYDHSSYLTLLQRNNYQVAVIDWTQDYSDPENFLSQILHTGTPNNNSMWSNRTFDRLVDRADLMPSANPQRFALYRRAEAIAMNAAATIPLVNPYAGILLRSNLKGLQVQDGFVLVRDWTKVRLLGGSS